ncbi:MFS siderochrome iron transporter C [Colletotrichum siamense]|uniref:MFS siderochrome iron transporter C n=1 Tax=Colletotrichum siamense TaxID=690259 RepID=UPI001872A43C|nr:MFS siderochrome iron transporter C [Colletotrichum siamense]KAF5494697.1 MFS siderochrome iron transporter C [Colletotrichum siamense]
MRFITSLKGQFRSDPRSSEQAADDSITVSRTANDVEAAGKMDDGVDDHDADDKIRSSELVESGVGTIEAVQAIWGKKGRWLVITGLALIMIVYEFDNTTVAIYNNYATSSFSALSKLATLGTANGIVFAVIKPPVAKVSNVIGRGQTYIMTISFYVLGYILMASSHGFDSYAAGAIFYTVGQSGTNIMNDIVIADITTARWRGFAISFSFFPFLITPWAAAFIIEDVVRPGGIGWRWGIGMFAILMPIGGAFIISTLLYFQRKAKQEGLAPSQKMTLYSFSSQIDLGGSALLSAGIAMVLLPLTLAAGSASAWQTPYIIALIILGGIILILLPMYEKFLAKHPIMPGHYFRNRTIVLCLFLIASDSIGFSCTHTYLYSWSTVARGFSARDATFFQYTNGVMQCVMGIIAGLAMAYTRRYKWLLISAAVIRMIGYGVMIRLRGADNSVAELFIVQIIQGLGSGIMQLSVLVPAQVVVPHREMPQITALVICFSIIGGSIGACIAGGIYTNTFKPALYRYLGNGASGQLVDSLFDSIVGTAPAWGTPERTAINHAFSDVMRYMVYTAVGASAPALVLSWFLPDFELPDRNNLVEE